MNFLHTMVIKNAHLRRNKLIFHVLFVMFNKINLEYFVNYDKLFLCKFMKAYSL